MSKALHIAISARAMSHPIGGVKEYVTEMVRALLSLSSPHRFSIYYTDPKLIGTNSRASEIYLSAPHKFIWDHVILPRRLAHDKPDLVWFPQNVSSLGLSLPTIVSVMDMLYFRIPEFPCREYAWLDTLYMRIFITRSLRRAHCIVTISDWTAHDIVRLINIPPEKIQTIHLAPGHEFKQLPKSESKSVRAKYNLTNPFFFYAGKFSRRKNLRVLIEAFGRVQHELPHDLVLTGGIGVVESPFDDIIDKYNLYGRVRRLGTVPKSDLVRLYNTADAFVFPSLYEGFGIPPLEAFACGCPVISSHATALSEVVGNAALTFDPHDVDTLASHLKAISTIPQLRTQLIQAGFERIQHFSYEYSAKKLLKVFEDVARYPHE